MVYHSHFREKWWGYVFLLQRQLFVLLLHAWTFHSANFRFLSKRPRRECAPPPKEGLKGGTNGWPHHPLGPRSAPLRTDWCLQKSPLPAPSPKGATICRPWGEKRALRTANCRLLGHSLLPSCRNPSSTAGPHPLTYPQRPLKGCLGDPGMLFFTSPVNGNWRPRGRF